MSKEIFVAFATQKGGIGKSLPFAQKVNAAGKVLNLHQPKTKQQ